MDNVLAKICAKTRTHVDACKQARPLPEIKRAASQASAPRGFKAALKAKIAAGGYGLIAEIKKASPSMGLIRADFDPPQLARAYQVGGAACLSVVTDEPFFQGKDEYLVAARGAVGLPALRKDFMLEAYQIWGSRALGADCILLIMACLDDATARDLAALAVELGMDVLVEVHDREELDRALKLPCQLIGVNNRNLKTLVVDLKVTESLAPHVPKDRMLVCESGLAKPEDLARMARIGAHCFLIGESFMRQKDVTAAVRTILAPPQSLSAAGG